VTFLGSIAVRPPINTPLECVGSSHRIRLGSPSNEPSEPPFSVWRARPERRRQLRSSSREASGRGRRSSAHESPECRERQRG